MNVELLEDPDTARGREEPLRGFSKMFVESRGAAAEVGVHFWIVIVNFKTLPSRKTVTTRGSPGFRAATLL
jgi:hypothetical protein